MPRRRKTLTEIYRPYLVQLMSFKDEVDYGKDHEWTDLELYVIRPRHVARWLKKRAYGTPDPGPDELPTEARDEGLQFAKKAVSLFMTWNVHAFYSFFPILAILQAFYSLFRKRFFRNNE